MDTKASTTDDISGNAIQATAQAPWKFIVPVPDTSQRTIEADQNSRFAETISYSNVPVTQCGLDESAPSPDLKASTSSAR